MKSDHQKALEPWQITAIQDDKRRGLSADTIAEKYRVGRRTVYRFLAGRVERVYVHGWTAFFFLPDHAKKKPPQRLTPWEPA